jgi:5-methylcytosine-specific restriction protein A
MKLFYHHVGKAGADEDFKKTVFNRVPNSSLEIIPHSEPYRPDIIRGVNAAFPEGSFNCWGVPSGADMVIRRLEVGDVVLLVKTTGEYGEIPALGMVKGFWKQQLRELSEALWGEGKYPYVFFFNTQVLDLTWMEFVEDLGIKPNFEPRGRFFSVATKRLAAFGGAAGYVDYLLKGRSSA